MSEDRLIGWLRRQLERRGPDLLGDDAAFLPRESWAVSFDQQIEGTHFRRGIAPATVARRLLAVNLSDLAAVGADPAYALLAVAVPGDYPMKPFFRALLDASDRHGIVLAGGDVARADTPAFGLTVLGRRHGRWVRRDGGRPGDVLWIGGTLGESAAGRRLLERGAVPRGRAIELPAGFPSDPVLAAAARRAVRRHLAPRPQLELGRWLARRRRAAAIDVSDGLLLDLDRLCRASETGARVDAEALPSALHFDRLSDYLGSDPVELAAGGGEDYVLLFALPAATEPPPDLGCQRIGRLVSGRAVRLSGGRSPGHRGWDHLS